MFDFEKFGSEEETKSGDISMNKITAPEKNKSSFDFDSFGSEQGVTTEPTIEEPADDRGFARKAFDALTSSVQGFGESAGQAINVQLYQKEADELSKKYIADGDKWAKLAKTTTDPVKQELYMNNSQKAYDEAGKTLQSIVGELKTPGQVLGEAAGVALDIATAGTYGAAAKTAVTGTKMAAQPIAKSLVPTAVSKLSSTGIKEAAKKSAVGAGIGYAYDISNNMQGGESGFEALTPGFATILGAGLPALGYAYGAGKELVKGKALDTIVSKGMQKGIRPSVAGKSSTTQIDAYHAKAADAVKAIVNNKPNLKLLDKYGDEVVGELPDTLDEFAEAVKQTKKTVFDEYDAMTQGAGKEGATVDLNRIIPELEKAGDDKVLNLADPGAASYAKEMAERFKNAGSLTTAQAQQFIADMNANLQSFYRNPTYGSGSKVQIDAMIANNMRESLDAVIESASGPGYQRLKSIYGALRTIEKDVAHRAIVDARKSNAGLIDFTNIFTYGDIAAGMASLNPGQIASGVIGKSIQAFYKWRNDPNTIVRSMFKNAEKAVKKENFTSKIPQKIEDNRTWINKMFPQEGKESPKAVMQTILDKGKGKGGLSVEDVKLGRPGYKNNGIKKNISEEIINKTRTGINIKEVSHNDFQSKFGEQIKKQGGGDYASGVYFKENGKPTIWINKDWLDMKSRIPGVSRDVMKNVRINHEVGHHIYEEVLTPVEKSKIKIPEAYKNEPKEFFSDAFDSWIKGKNESWMGNVSDVLNKKFNKKGSANIKTLLAGGAASGVATSLSGKKTITIDNEQKPEVKGVETKKETPNIGKTPDEKNKVIATIVAEAIGEGEEGLQASINTVMNRSKEKGKTMYEVVSQPAQYSAFSTSNDIFSKVRDLLRGKPVQFKNQTEKKSIEEATKKVKQMIEDGNLKDITNGATHYFNEKTMTDKSWMKEGVETAKIGKHTFRKGIRYN